MTSEINIGGKNFIKFIDEAEIAGIVKTMAADISDLCRQDNPLFLCLLKGSFMFTADLLRALPMEADVEFVRVSSYVGMQTTGKFREWEWDSDNVKGRNVIIIEDIVDTGLTLRYIYNRLQELEVESIRIATLLLKPSAYKWDQELDFVGKEIEDKFVIGYGLDWDEVGRGLPCIYQLDE